MTTINTVEELKSLPGETLMLAADGHLFHAGVYQGVWHLADKHELFPAQTVSPRVVTEAEVEHLANVICEADPLGNYMSSYRDMARAALTYLGFEVQG